MNDVIRNNFRENQWMNPMSPTPEYDNALRRPVQEPVTPPQEWQEPAMPFIGFNGMSGGVVEAPRSPSGIVPEGPMGELSGLTAIDIFNQPTAVNEQSLQYLNGFLLTQIGKRITAEFLIGSNTIESRTGTLIGVGANYILLSEFPSNNILSCDFYSIKFIRFYYS